MPSVGEGDAGNVGPATDTDCVGALDGLLGLVPVHAVSAPASAAAVATALTVPCRDLPDVATAAQRDHDRVSATGSGDPMLHVVGRRGSMHPTSDVT